MDYTGEIIGLGTVPAVLMLVQLAKSFIADTRLYPPIAMAVGVAIHLVLALALNEATGQGLAQHALQGLVVGLAATGLWSGVSRFKEGPK